MTPEERINRLKSDDRWTVNEIFTRPDAIPGRPFRWVVPTIAATMAVLVAAVLVVGALTVNHNRSLPPAITMAPTDVATPTPTVAPTSTPTPTPAAITKTGLKAPTPIFGGDCSKLFSTATMSDITGTPMKPFSYESEPSVPSQRGDITCTWIDRGSNSIELTVVRDSPDLDVPARSCGIFTSGEGSTISTLCLFDSVSHDVRIGGGVFWSTKDRSRQISQRLISRFATLNTSSAAGAAPTLPSGSWPGVTCEKIGKITVDGVKVNVATEIMGTDASSLPVQDAIAGGNSASGGCFANFTNPDGSTGNFGFSAFGGGAWNFDVLLGRFSPQENATGVTLAGFDHAVQFAGGFAVTTGSNYINLTFSGVQDPAALLASIKAQLDALK